MPKNKKKKVIKKEKTWIYLIVLGLVCAGAFLLRVLPQLDKVFVNGQVWFREVDGWYHLRLIDNMMVNFPHILRFDIYAVYPNGSADMYYPLLSWLTVIISKLTTINYEVVAAFLPPILGTLTLIPIYFLCKELFSKRVGILACILAAILPGEFLHRTLLGFADHHAEEVLLMMSSLLFLILALKTNKWIWRILAGTFIGFYILNWVGAAFFLLIIGIFIWIKAVKENITIPLCLSIIVPMGITLAMSFWLVHRETLVALVVLIMGPPSVLLLNRLVRDRKLTLIPIVLIPLCIIGLFHRPILNVFWGGLATYIQEAAPLTPTVLFNTYGIAFILGVIGLLFYIKGKGNLLFIVWATILLIVTVGQRRWGYYTAIPIAMLASYLVFYIAKFVKENTRTAVVVVMCFFMILPMVNHTVRISSLPNNITTEWHSTLTWLGENTPDPLPPEVYYQLESTEKAKYGILSWWDYGHWIIRISHRIPLSSPTHASAIPGKFFTAQSEETANKVLEGLNIKYVIIDSSLLTGKWYAVVISAGLSLENKDKILANSMLLKLWSNKAEGYKLIHEEGYIKVFEKV